jgi:hypothetical protein
MFRFDHDASRHGVGGRPESSGPADPQICETPLERVAAPAIYWLRIVRGERSGTGRQRQSQMSD